MNALFPGTFDPITLGHENLIARAMRLFDRVIIAVAQSDAKNPLFPFQQRLALLQAIYQECERITVVGFSGLLIETCQQYQAHTVIRGVRSASDFDYERQLAEMNHKLDTDFETVFLNAQPDLACISSSLVREIAKLGGDYRGLVSPIVADALHKKFS